MVYTLQLHAYASGAGAGGRSQVALVRKKTFQFACGRVLFHGFQNGLASPSPVGHSEGMRRRKGMLEVGRREKRDGKSKCTSV